jgi:dipeptidyl-peptidase-4
MHRMKHCWNVIPLFVVGLCAVNAADKKPPPPNPLSDLPGFANYERVRKAVGKLNSAGRVSRIEWAEDGRSMSFVRGTNQFRLNLADFSIKDLGKPKKPKPQSGPPPHRSPRVGRARQATQVLSPNGKWMARYRDFNVVIETAPPKKKPSQKETKPVPADTNATQVISVTKGGTDKFRYGTACWVYGEELRQSSAMWWSPDSRRLAFYEMDERNLRDYHLTTANTANYTGVQTVRYPKSGDANPVAGLLIYDRQTRRTTRVNVGGDPTQYIFNARFAPDGSALLFNRTNRRQDTLEIVAADSATGHTRVVVREKQPAWQNNRPLMRFLDDKKRFIWETERIGWKQYELRHLDGSRLGPISNLNGKPVTALVKVDEKAGWIYFTARSGGNPLNDHLHRVRLDGTGHTRLTRNALYYSTFNISPDHKWFVARREALGVPPVMALFDTKGNEVVVLALQSTDDKKMVAELGLAKPELFACKAADGKTIIYGTLYKPANFDPKRKYPLLVSVYGGPSSRGVSNRYSAANPYCEFGFLVATIANRGTSARGKAFETAGYLKLGTVDLDDQATGVRHLAKRPYVDVTRVGIAGHSYGGYMSALALLRYPDVFHVGVAGAPVTDWKNYDTIYTERYMRTPKENPDGYRTGSCLTHAKNLKGKLFLLHGLIDDNVHPANTWQLADALQRAGKQFDMMIYPRSKHGLISHSGSLRWLYLHRHLKPKPIISKPSK